MVLQLKSNFPIKEFYNVTYIFQTVISKIQAENSSYKFNTPHKKLPVIPRNNLEFYKKTYDCWSYDLLPYSLVINLTPLHTLLYLENR